MVQLVSETVETGTVSSRLDGRVRVVGREMAESPWIQRSVCLVMSPSELGTERVRLSAEDLFLLHRD